ncbi:uncharacterized protein LOC123561103 [Mercenaria mercenaria]|uniref:uncharacterized protein LOC123561103 n=1 Tax=Mercenaria mercenaria TaxID=6596 RepID=UPI00234F510B|nr:uncharacterized protein LOC123561103 [Mercenaria mercenaria]
MDKEHYKQMVVTILDDLAYYEKLKGEPSKSDRMKYNKLIVEFQYCLTDKEIDYLQNFEVKTSNFYGLPKVHKSKHISELCKKATTEYVEVTNVTDLKLRPIVAGPACQTHRLSNVLDILLRPLTKYVPSYLRDSTDFLNSLPEKITARTILASFDVESLYSNIPHVLGLEALQYWLNLYPEEIPKSFDKEFIMEAAKLILLNTTFYFNGKYYRQIKGTAMGTKFAPVYATLVIGYLENKLYNDVSSTFGEEFKDYFKDHWKRFLDDIFILWTRSTKDLEILEKLLNSLNENLNLRWRKATLNYPSWMFL